MSGLVTDASAFGPILFPDERGDLIPGLFDRIIDKGAAAAQHWPLELTSMMRVGVRRQRINAEELPDLVAMMRDLPVTLDTVTGEKAWTATLDLAARYDLTVYDAAYLELAIREKLPLATADAALIRAVRAEGLDLIS